MVFGNAVLEEAKLKGRKCAGANRTLMCFTDRKSQDEIFWKKKRFR